MTGGQESVQTIQARNSKLKLAHVCSILSLACLCVHRAAELPAILQLQSSEPERLQNCRACAGTKTTWDSIMHCSETFLWIASCSFFFPHFLTWHAHMQICCHVTCNKFISRFNDEFYNLFFISIRTLYAPYNIWGDISKLYTKTKSGLNQMGGRIMGRSWREKEETDQCACQAVVVQRPREVAAGDV